MKHRTGGSDALGVLVSDLREILLPIVEAQDAAREDYLKSGNYDPKNGQVAWALSWPSSRDAISDRPLNGAVLGGISYIAHTVGTTSRRVWNIVYGNQKWVTLQTADNWLSALGLQHKFSMLKLVPNPMWSQERWMKWHAEQACFDDEIDEWLEDESDLA